MSSVDVVALASASAPKAFPNVEKLDVTIRDGGFMNAFGWDAAFMERYADRMFRGGFSSIELGYLGGVSSSTGWYEGLAADLTPEFLHKVSQGRTGLHLYAIVNPWRMRALRDLREFTQAGLRTLRVAYNEKHADKVWDIVEQAKAAGLRAIINIATVSKLSDQAIDTAVVEATRRGVNGVFFADTCSAMRPDEIQALYKRVSAALGADAVLGLHGHDFNGFGVANAYMAALNGANAIDMSVRSVGRGGGNVSAEMWIINALLGGDTIAADFQCVLEARRMIEERFGISETSLLPAVTAACNLNPELLEEVYASLDISKQNALAGELIRAVVGR